MSVYELRFCSFDEICESQWLKFNVILYEALTNCPFKFINISTCSDFFKCNPGEFELIINNDKFELRHRRTGVYYSFSNNRDLIQKEFDNIFKWIEKDKINILSWLNKHGYIGNNNDDDRVIVYLFCKNHEDFRNFLVAPQVPCLKN